MFFQNVTNTRNNTNSSSSFQQQLKIVDHNKNNNTNISSFTTSASTSTPSATRKRTQTWVEGTAILNQRNKIVSQDVEEAWENLLRELPTSSSSSSPTATTKLYCASLHNSNTTTANTTNSFMNEFGFSSSNEHHHDQQGLTILSTSAQQQHNNTLLSSLASDFETQQVLSTHRQLRQSLDRLKKDELGLANLVSNATEELDLGEGLRGTSVSRIRSATQTIESSLATLKEEERALGDVVAEAEKVAASVTKKMMMSPSWKASRQQQQQQQQNNTNNIQDQQQQQQYFDPYSSSLSTTTHNQQNQNNQQVTTKNRFSADEKLKSFLNRVGGRTFGWTQQEHDCFMHVLFSGGFEDPSITNATPNLGLRCCASLSSQNNNNINHHQGLADDEQWVAAQVVEKLSPLLPHRLPDDIRKHLALQRELEFLEMPPGPLDGLGRELRQIAAVACRGLRNPSVTVALDHRQGPAREISQSVGQVGVISPHQAFQTEVAVLAEDDFAQQIVAQALDAHHLVDRTRPHDIAPRLAHLLVLEDQPAMGVDFLRQGQAGRHQERRPVHGVKTKDLLAHQVQVGGPEFLGVSLLLLASPVASIAECGHVIRQGVEPNVENMPLAGRHRDAPL